MDRSMRVQKARELADEVIKEIANETADDAAEEARHRAEYHGLDEEECETAAKKAHDEAYQESCGMISEFVQDAMLRLLNSYERQPHPASVPAASLAAEVVEELDVEHQSPREVALLARMLLTRLANKILQACKLPEEPN